MNLRPMARPVSRALAIIAACVAARSADAQTVTGRVTAAGSAEPVPAARVIAVGTNSVAVTSEDGRYTLKHVAPGTVELQVLRMGYSSQKKTVQVPAAANATADFQLSATVAKLAEVVSTATGEQRTVELGHTTA